MFKLIKLIKEWICKAVRFVKEMFTKEFWVQPFPDYYPPECFDCNDGSCEGCPLK